MRGQTVVLDSGNLPAVIADATGEPLEVAKPPEPAAEAAKEPPKETPAVEVKAEPADEQEDENGLTTAEKKDLTEKMQRAIGKKHRAMKEAEEFAEDQYKERRMAEQRAEQLQREIERMKAQLQPEPPKVEAEAPKRETFKTDEEYLDAVVDWKVEQKQKALAVETEKQREADARAAVVKEAQSRITKAAELVPDFSEVVSKTDVTVPPHIAAYMAESEMIAEIGYHFAKNPAELEKLNGMSHAKALVAIGKIEAILKPFAKESATETAAKETNGTTPPKVETVLEPSKERPRASAPITPLNGGSANQVQKEPRDRTYAEERAEFERRNKIKLGKRQRH